MLSRIRKRAYELFLIGCLFGIGILYYYAIVITAIPHRPLSVTLRNVSRRELYHTRYHRPSILLASTEWHSEKEDHLEGYKTKWNSKDQQIRLLKTEIKSNHKFQKLSHFNKLIPAESIPNDITESKKLKVKLDRYSIVPVPSSSVFEIVRGGEFLDKRVLEVSLGCKAIIYRDKINAYGKCKNFTRMRFINGSRTVAMASFPGSGSTWVRSVLEQASGIYTGSIYCDNELKSKGFVGEKVSSSNVLFVKTHYASKDLFIPLSEYYDPKKFKDITAAILLIRNPLDSIISSWNWVHSGHTATVPASSFGNFSRWRNFVSKNIKYFTKMVHYWLEEANISTLLVIRYEDMLTDLATQIKKMLDFLNTPYSVKDIDCVVNSKMESYHRIKHGEPSNHYISIDRKLVLNNLMSVETLLNKYNVSYKDVF